MKKHVTALFSLLLCTLLLLSGCSSLSKGELSMGADVNAPMDSASSAAPEEYAPEPDMPAMDAAEAESNGSFSGTGVSNLLDHPATADSSDKIIYSAWVDLETLDFDQSLKDVYALIDRCGGFLENADVSGTDYSSQFHGYKNYRSANFTIRVPKAQFSQLLDSLGSIGNVTYTSTQAENITSQFTDTESRLAMYKTEEERLLAMLEKADTVEDMILIESRLSDVRYNIESLTTQLNNWQKQVDYSTVTLHLNEVAKLTEEIPVQRSYWEQVGDSLKSVLTATGNFFKDFLRIFIAALPILFICAVITGLVLVIVFSARRARKKRHAAKQNDAGAAKGQEEKQD